MKSPDAPPAPPPPSTPARYAAAGLTIFAATLLNRAGLEPAKSSVVAETLVEGDLLGHTTHGLALLASYLQELERDTMTRTGEPAVISDFPAAVTWDGRRLPGPCVVRSAIALASERARSLGTCAVAIRRSHHLACLAAYLREVAAAGQMILLTCSDQNAAAVAPFGGTRAIYSPNPIAAAWLTAGDPVMLDVSTSITTVGTVRRARAEGRTIPGSWLLDANGSPTADPAVMSADPKGSLLPIGGLNHGHKGYALGLLVEALTAGLAGHGRVDPATGWSATVYIQIWQPEAFAGRAAFEREMTRLSELCHGSPPRDPTRPVRLPGESGLRRREEALAKGVALYPTILPALEPWAQKWNLPMPVAVPPVVA